jgi:hypothetical protein
MRRVTCFSTAALIVLAATSSVSRAQSTGSSPQRTRSQNEVQQNKSQQAKLQKQLEQAKQQEVQLRDRLKKIKDQLGGKPTSAQRQPLRTLQEQVQAQLQTAKLQQARLQQVLKQLAAQQAALVQAAQQQAAQQPLAAQSAAQQAAVEEAYRQQLLQQQQDFYKQLYKEEMPKRPATDGERQQGAIAKILGAVFFKAAGKAAEDAEDDVVAILGPVVCERISSGLIESAVKDVFPNLPAVGIRAVARAARLCLDGKLSTIDFLEATAKDELKEALKSDPDLAPAVEALGFLIDLGKAAAKRAG